MRDSVTHHDIPSDRALTRQKLYYKSIPGKFVDRKGTLCCGGQVGHERGPLAQFSLAKKQIDRVEGSVSNDVDGDDEEGDDGGNEEEISEQE